jgi:ribokinase
MQPGGAALHASVAAKTLTDEVRLASVVGKDYPFMEVLGLFPHRYLKASSLPSTRFNIRYDERWEAHYLRTDYGAGSRISPSTVPFEEIKPKSIIHISPLSPAKVDKIVGKIRDTSPSTKISINTWIGYIKGRKNRRVLKELARKVDFFIVNDSEAKALTEAESLSIALRLLKAKTLIVTLGEFGAIVNTEDGEVQMVPALRFPVEKIIDTTGAGDAWCGAFLAAYKLTEDFVKSVTAASVISSIKCTGWGCSKLLDLRFKSVDHIAEYVIGLKEGSLQKRILDYYP